MCRGRPAWEIETLGWDHWRRHAQKHTGPETTLLKFCFVVWLHALSFPVLFVPREAPLGRLGGVTRGGKWGGSWAEERGLPLSWTPGSASVLRARPGSGCAGAIPVGMGEAGPRKTLVRRGQVTLRGQKGSARATGARTDREALIWAGREEMIRFCSWERWGNWGTSGPAGGRSGLLGPHFPHWAVVECGAFAPQWIVTQTLSP